MTNNYLKMEAHSLPKRRVCAARKKTNAVQFNICIINQLLSGIFTGEWTYEFIAICIPAFYLWLGKADDAVVWRLDARCLRRTTALLLVYDCTGDDRNYYTRSSATWVCSCHYRTALMERSHLQLTPFSTYSSPNLTTLFNCLCIVPASLWSNSACTDSRALIFSTPSWPELTLSSTTLMLF